MSASSRLLAASLLGTHYRLDTGASSKLRLGPVGRCPATPTLFIVVCDDSGSITAPGGADPISNRYVEIRAAMGAVAKACRCGRELAAVVHFDTPHGDTEPQPLTRGGIRALEQGLYVPAAGFGTSNLLPGLRAARQLADDHPNHEVVLSVLSDFALTDQNPDVVTAELKSFPGTLIACLLGGSGAVVDGADQTIGINYGEPAGALAQAVLTGLTMHRLGPSSGTDTSSSGVPRGRFHNALLPLRRRAPANSSTPDRAVRVGRRAVRRADRDVSG